MHAYPKILAGATCADSRAFFPADFDPQKYPILSRHWFGIEPCANARQAAFDALRGDLTDLISLEAAHFDSVRGVPLPPGAGARQ